MTWTALSFTESLTETVDQYDSFCAANITFTQVELSETYATGVAMDKIRIVMDEQPALFNDDGSSCAWAGDAAVIVRYARAGVGGTTDKAVSVVSAGGGVFTLTIDLVADHGSAQEITSILIEPGSQMLVEGNVSPVISDVEYETSVSLFWEDYVNTAEAL